MLFPKSQFVRGGRTGLPAQGDTAVPRAIPLSWMRVLPPGPRGPRVRGDKSHSWTFLVATHGTCSLPSKTRLELDQTCRLMAAPAIWSSQRQMDSVSSKHSSLLEGQREACGFSMHAFPLSANSSRIYLRSGTFMNSHLTNFLLEVDEFAFRLQFGMTELRLEALQFINLNGVHTLHTPVRFHLLSRFCRWDTRTFQFEGKLWAPLIFLLVT